MNLVKAFSGLSGRAGLFLKTKSPEILLVSGIGLIVTGVVLACKETLRVEEIFDEIEQRKEKIENAVAVAEQAGDDEIELVYTVNDQQRDLVKTYAKAGLRLVRLYAPGALCVGGGIACIIWGHRILKGRLVGVMAAYKGLKEAYDGFYERVREKYGDEEAELLKHGGMGYEKVLNEDTGEERPAMILPNGVALSPYSRLFDELNAPRTWSKSPAHNLYFLRCQENAANEWLRIRGHFFLNEVYDLLDLERTEAGAVVGWKLGNGDDVIKFGIFDTYGMYEPEDVGVSANGIMLDFNVDGVIYDKIETKKPALMTRRF